MCSSQRFRGAVFGFEQEGRIMIFRQDLDRIVERIAAQSACTCAATGGVSLACRLHQQAPSRLCYRDGRLVLVCAECGARYAEIKVGRAMVWTGE